MGLLGIIGITRGSLWWWFSGIFLFSNMAELYTNAARIVEKVLKKQGSPKSLVINNGNVRNKKKLYALVCEALKCKILR